MMKKFATASVLVVAMGTLMFACSNGQDCISHDHTLCTDGVNYWIDSCDRFEDVIAQCNSGCKPDKSGCVGDATACDEPNDCLAGQGCLLPAGVCGFCGKDADCRSGEKCNKGVCSVGCSAGPCCDDDGLLRPASYQCGSWTEYRCTGTECGADSQQRGVTQACSGVSPDCDGSLFEGMWQYIERCSNNQTCWADENGAGCTQCAVICQDGACTNCTDEACCNNGAIAASGTICDSQTEYRCASSDCGADAESRTVTRVCEGTSVVCAGDIVEGSWNLVTECDTDAVCWADNQGAGCTTCDDGCDSGACIQVCTDGPCCDNGSLRDSSYECDSWQEYQCTGSACGADAQELTAIQHCSGASSDCDGTITRGEWATVDDCDDGALCRVDDNGSWCEACETGCSGETCTPCTDEPCCDNGQLRPSNFQCDAWTEYRCNGSDCGADAQQRAVRQYCSGSSAYCNGTTSQDGWSTIDVCHADDICTTDDQTYAECQNCPAGCAAGQCN